MKLNFDASFFEFGPGFGLVLRNHMGVILKCVAGPLWSVRSADHIEIMAAWSS